jgi:hypothetical protein
LTVLADSSSAQEIADAPLISRGTASSHIAAILDNLSARPAPRPRNGPRATAFSEPPTVQSLRRGH